MCSVESTGTGSPASLRSLRSLSCAISLHPGQHCSSHQGSESLATGEGLLLHKDLDAVHADDALQFIQHLQSRVKLASLP